MANPSKQYLENINQPFIMIYIRNPRKDGFAMAFDPGLKISDEVSNDQLRKIFKCGNMGGMRKSSKTGTLVIISDKTKPFYHDNWKDGVLLYTGMGKYGDHIPLERRNGRPASLTTATIIRELP